MKDDFAEQGLGIVAISHDTEAILREFAQKKNITIPLLSDVDSKAIRAFGIMNHNVPEDSPDYGMAFAGQYVVDADGVVTAKYFEQNHRERVTMETVLVRDFGWRPGARGRVETDALVVEYAASAPVARPGTHITLIIDVQLKDRMHVYAPGVQGGYRPVSWSIPSSDLFRGAEPEFPEGSVYVQEALGDTALVYRQAFRILQPVEIADRKSLEKGLGGQLGPDRELVIEGTFRYQACDDTACFLPQEVPLRFVFKTERHDWQRTESRRPGR